MEEKDLRVKKTKQNIEKALLQLLKEKSMDKITITELCKASNITRRTFYLHYESVQYLFEILIERLLKELESSMLEAKENRLAAQSILEPQFIQLFQHVYDYKDFYDIIFSRNTHFALYDLFYNRIKKMIKNSMIGMAEYADTEFHVAYQANAILGLILEWRAQNYHQSINEMNILAIEITLRP